jgi:hypothetical protein
VVAPFHVTRSGKRSAKPVMGFADRLRILATQRAIFGSMMTHRGRHGVASALQVWPTKLQSTRGSRRWWRGRRRTSELSSRTIVSGSKPQILPCARASRATPVRASIWGSSKHLNCKKSVRQRPYVHRCSFTGHYVSVNTESAPAVELTSSLPPVLHYTVCCTRRGAYGCPWTAQGS